MDDVGLKPQDADYSVMTVRLTWIDPGTQS